MCGILKQMLEYAVDAEYLEKNPYRIKVNKKSLLLIKSLIQRKSTRRMKRN